MTNVQPEEIAWISIIVLSASVTAWCFVDAYRDWWAARGDGKALVAAEHFVASEALRLVQQALLLVLTVPALFAPRDPDATLLRVVLSILFAVLLTSNSLVIFHLRRRLRPRRG